MIHEIQEERRILLLFENLAFAFCTLVFTSHVVLEFRCRRMIRAFLAPHSWNVARSNRLLREKEQHKLAVSSSRSDPANLQWGERTIAKLVARDPLANVTRT